MTTREQILSQIKKNKPALVALPELPLFQESEELNLAFGNCLEKIGGTLVDIENLASLPQLIKNNFPTVSSIASSFLPDAHRVDSNTENHILERVELVVLRADFGVAENGAVWLPEHEMLHRALPFITQHLVLVLRRNALVSTMHQAYQRLSMLPSYGVFIAGPSKTADIEQSLVIGAHGARSMTIVLY